jgi:hypothetical protein
MTESLGEHWLPECDHLALESELSWIKTPIREKPRNEIGIECLGHQSHESLSSSTIEEGIMDDSDLGFFVSHAKRILKKDEKTIEFILINLMKRCPQHPLVNLTVQKHILKNLKLYTQII